ncbi:uncharacterized [Lates japonicus]
MRTFAFRPQSRSTNDAQTVGKSCPPLLSAREASRTCIGFVSSPDVSTLRGWEILQNQDPVTAGTSVETLSYICDHPHVPAEH